MLIVLSILVLAFLHYYVLTEEKMTKWRVFGLGIVIGGVVGNLIDRIVLGYVRDFIDFVIFNYNFPIFNIADIAVVIGVILIIFEIIFEERIHGKN